MKILVLSDSHGDTESIVSSCKVHKPDVIIFLGDGYEDLNFALPYLCAPVYAVRGNNDFYPCRYPYYRIAQCSDVNFYLTHGHLENVRFGRNALINKCKDKNCRAALYGHTHLPYCSDENGIFILNPGSSRNGTCGIINVEGGNISGEIREINK